MLPDQLRRAGGALRAFGAGAALGVLGFAAGSLLLYRSGGVLDAAGGLVATFAAALAAGVWAGTPGATGENPPTARWLFSGAALGVAGVAATVWTLYDGDSLGEAARALGLLVMIGLPVYAVGLLLPALAAWERARREDEEGDDRHPTSIAPAVLAGAAVGTAAAGLFLLPALAPGPLILGTALLLTFPVFSPLSRGGAGETEETVLHEAQTPFGSLKVTEIVYPGKRQPERRLYQNDEVESGELVRSGAPTFAYIAAGERVLADLSARRQAYLFLGGGAYTLPRRVAERDTTARIAVVELDPEVTRSAYRYFGVRPEHRIESIHGDARQVADELPAGEWDRLFVDVYDGTETVPYPLVTLEAMRSFGRLLRPGGVMVMNVIGVAEGEGDRRFWSTVRTAREAFPSFRLYYHLSRDFPERQNFLLAASMDADAPLPAAAGTFEPWPEAEWPRLSDTVVFRDRFPTADERRAAALPPSRARPETG
ncbi:MAG TPA: fused MFS/spermidine synthase [Longimicrobium sp.]|nr:fused MFS/spermidine synthase [Longimicrobium sp.]